MQDLGTLGRNLSYAYGVSADGGVVVGVAPNANDQLHAFRWTAAGGMQDLGTLGGTESYGYGASANGAVIVGDTVTAANPRRAFRWVPVLITFATSNFFTCPTGTATFAVTASGSSNFTYQWQIEDPSAAPPTFINLVNGPIVLGGVLIGTSSGATTREWHTVLTASAGGTNRVRCIVSNACGSVTSGPATLTICAADFNCDGELNPDDLADFVGAYFALPAIPAADFNGDGENNPDDLADYIGVFFAGC